MPKLPLLFALDPHSSYSAVYYSLWSCGWRKQWGCALHPLPLLDHSSLIVHCNVHRSPSPTCTALPPPSTSHTFAAPCHVGSTASALAAESIDQFGVCDRLLAATWALECSALSREGHRRYEAAAGKSGNADLHQRR